MEFTEEETLEKEPESFEDESVEHVVKRGEPKSRMTSWKWARCDRMCRASVHLMSQLVGCEGTRSSGQYYFVSILIFLFILLISCQTNLVIVMNLLK